MHRGTIRLALPAAAIAAALVLSGCGEDEDTSSSGSAPSEDAGQGGGEEQAGEEQESGAQSSESQGPKPQNLSEIDPASLPEGVTPDDLVELIPEDLDSLIPWDQLEELGLGGGEEERRPATVDELQGYWYTGPEDSDAALSFEAEEVMFIEDMLAEGDICYGSVAAEGSMELPYCTMYGDQEWTARTATLEFEGSALIVTWEDGTEHEYYNDQATM